MTYKERAEMLKEENKLLREQIKLLKQINELQSKVKLETITYSNNPYYYEPGISCGTHIISADMKTEYGTC